MRRASPSVAILLLAFAASGCGGGGHAAQAQGKSTDSSSVATQPARPAATTLERAIRTAVKEDHRVAVESLWTNRVPAKPLGIAGPALSDLRKSAAQRRAEGLRIRTLSDRFRILSVTIDPSYESATASVTDAVKVQPSDRRGRPHGRPSATLERVRLELRRVDSEERFVVWNVSLL